MWQCPDVSLLYVILVLWYTIAMLCEMDCGNGDLQGEWRRQNAIYDG